MHQRLLEVPALATLARHLACVRFTPPGALGQAQQGRRQLRRLARLLAERPPNVDEARRFALQACMQATQRDAIARPETALLAACLFLLHGARVVTSPVGKLADIKWPEFDSSATVAIAHHLAMMHWLMPRATADELACLQRVKELLAGPCPCIDVAAAQALTGIEALRTDGRAVPDAVWLLWACRLLLTGGESSHDGLARPVALVGAAWRGHAG